MAEAAGEKKILRVGLLGAGRIGRTHATAIASIQEARIEVIADVYEPAASSLAEQYNVPGGYVTEWEQVMSMDNVDAVIIASPTDQHAAQLMAAARAGKAIFCEKPISLNLATIDEAAAVIEETGTFCMIAFQRRFDSNFQRLRKAVEDGQVGDVSMVHIVSRDPGPPPVDYLKQSGGMHTDMCIHDADVARWLVGAEVEEVFCYGSCRVDPAIGEEAGDIDTSCAMMRFENGVVVTIDNCRKATYGYDQRVEVFGSNGMVQSDNRFANQCTVSDGESVRRDLPMNFFMDRYAEAYRNEIVAFVEAVNSSSPPPCGVAEGRAAARITAAMKRSMDEHRAVRIEEITA